MEEKIVPIPEIDKLNLRTTISVILPKIKDIPEEFKNNKPNKWIKAQQDWFFCGIKKDQLIEKEGFDKDKAIKVLGIIQKSWEPSHEHKEAAVAYLMSCWFSDYIPLTSKEVADKLAKLRDQV